jgi:hypothetical protein
VRVGMSAAEANARVNMAASTGQAGLRVRLVVGDPKLRW